MGNYFISPDLDLRKDTVLFDNGKHMVIYLGSRGVASSNEAVDVLSYLIVNNNEAILIDPGGYHLFPLLVANVTKYISLEKIKYIYFCHQDPDVCGSLPMWKDVCPKGKIVIGELWTRFLPHFGVEDMESSVHPIPMEGGHLNLGRVPLEIIPAHYMHSPNHFSIYDPVSKFLFTGDIGIALGDIDYLVVKDWMEHMDKMYIPHRILMCSNKVTRGWAERIKNLEIKAILPQHGAIIPEQFVKYFLRFMENIKCGVDLV
ncbi:metallo-beta-lactamase superfamily hydrolase [Desulfurobacterium thermolithotrophum DSM 11699]|uniref:Metallo-beta-lactamase superfamily hydrolase n=1 Tax=Desulfurobacterium thermolithotrophum (strain DSM 11699 / BSA) TaxID=868864 RepID=F0S0H2_DESTD|nr:MBL fold metallo-hydrolase [Desulfurobacterium thermolithotrophum]ADY72700.1 metallo-beta-lactamase superfamily hydrolase [Desulfurobacterium thermolithotrophum DSM 11699]